MDHLSPTARPASLQKPGRMVIARSECTGILWRYLCDRYGLNPAETMLLMLDPPRTAAAEMRRETGL